VSELGIKICEEDDHYHSLYVCKKEKSDMYSLKNDRKI